MSSNRKYIVLGVGLVISCIIFGLFFIKKFTAASSEEPSEDSSAASSIASSAEFSAAFVRELSAASSKEPSAASFLAFSEEPFAMTSATPYAAPSAITFATPYAAPYAAPSAVSSEESSAVSFLAFSEEPFAMTSVITSATPFAMTSVITSATPFAMTSVITSATPYAASSAVSSAVSSEKPFATPFAVSFEESSEESSAVSSTVSSTVSSKELSAPPTATIFELVLAPSEEPSAATSEESSEKPSEELSATLYEEFSVTPSEDPSTALFKAPFLDLKNSLVLESFGSWSLDVSTAYDEFIRANEKNKKLSKEDFAIILNSLYFAVKDRFFFLRENIIELIKFSGNFLKSGYVESAKKIERDLKKFINIQNQFYDFFKDLFEENNNFQKFLDPQYHLFEFNIEDGKIILDKEEISIIKTFGEYLKNLENYKFLISEQNRDKIFEKTFSTNLGNISGAELMTVKLVVFLKQKYFY